MTDPGRLIGQGRRADIYDIGGGRVLRRYREVARDVEREAQVMRHAFAQGVPVPEVFDVAGTTDVVMEALVGSTMLEDLARRPWTMVRHARTLARLHETVHAVKALEWMRAPFGEGDRLLHVDLHPLNVILTTDGPRIIDWEGAAKGPAEADVAMGWILIRTGEVPGPAAQRFIGTAGQALFARLFLAAVRPRLDRRWIASAAAFRVQDETVTAVERRRLLKLIHDGAV